MHNGAKQISIKLSDMIALTSSLMWFEIKHHSHDSFKTANDENQSSKQNYNEHKQEQSVITLIPIYRLFYQRLKIKIFHCIVRQVSAKSSLYT